MKKTDRGSEISFEDLIKPVEEDMKRNWLDYATVTSNNSLTQFEEVIRSTPILFLGTDIDKGIHSSSSAKPSLEHQLNSLDEFIDNKLLISKQSRKPTETSIILEKGEKEEIQFNLGKTIYADKSIIEEYFPEFQPMPPTSICPSSYTKSREAEIKYWLKSSSFSSSSKIVPII